MPPTRQRRTLFLFGALTVYIVLQSAWWAWLLVRKDRELEQLVNAFGLRPDDPGWSDVHATRTLWMVLGEGSVFVALMLVALWLVYRAVRHDLALARQQHDFLLAVSHELRTPIAGMKLHLQTLERSTLDPDQRGELHRRALDDVDRLNALTERILLATRLEEMGMPLEIGTHDLRMLTERVSAHALNTYSKGHPIHVSATTITARVDPAAFTSVLENLIENAAKYSHAGTSIDVSLERLGDRAVVSVSDRGPGIADADRSRVFEKFQRSGEESVRRAKGTGLGLFIVERLMRAMHGTVTLRSRPGGGSIFEASFPLH